jgi:hypothetical protein
MKHLFLTLGLLALVCAGTSAAQRDSESRIERDEAESIKARFEDFHRRRFGNAEPPAENLRVKAIEATQRKRSKLDADVHAETPRWIQKGP